MRDRYFNGLILPLILTTLTGFFAFFINPAAGERIGLGVTILLMMVVFYSTAMDLLPKTFTMTVFSKLYLWSTVTSMLTLMASVLAVSLTNIHESVGLMSETKLLQVFLDADADSSGELAGEEIKTAVIMMGLRDEKLRKLQGLIETKKQGNDGKVSFPDWFDIVMGIAESDGLAANHNALVWMIVVIFSHFERKV